MRCCRSTRLRSADRTHRSGYPNGFAGASPPKLPCGSTAHLIKLLRYFAKARSPRQGTFFEGVGPVAGPSHLKYPANDKALTVFTLDASRHSRLSVLASLNCSTRCETPGSARRTVIASRHLPSPEHSNARIGSLRARVKRVRIPAICLEMKAALGPRVGVKCLHWERFSRALECSGDGK